MSDKEISLDSTESLYVDMIGYKELAARRGIDLAKRDLVDCDNLKKQLLQRLSQRAKLENGQTVSIDFDRKVAIVANPPTPIT